MKKSQFSEAKIVEILALAGQGQSIEDICRQFNISSATFYNWRNRYGGMDIEELRKSKALEAENARPPGGPVKKLLADKSLDYDVLNDAYQLLKNR